jgi:hypothetical protein
MLDWVEFGEDNLLEDFIVKEEDLFYCAPKIIPANFILTLF